jgi:predicted outer membrane repeat protein
MNCSGNKIQEIDQFLITGATFHGQGSKTTALELIEVIGTIVESIFLSHLNTEGKFTTLTVVEDWITDNIHNRTLQRHAGGALFVTRSTVTIISSIFRNNGAEVGGALFCELESSITAMNTSFSLNQAISINECYGGAILSQRGCSMTIVNAIFYKNTACSFTGEGGGGAIVAFNGSRIDIKMCEFTYSISGFGGALLTWKAVVMVTESTFNSNKAIWQGGVLCIVASIMNISSSNFNDNRAISSGGVIHASSTTVYIVRSEFINNDASLGGAISSFNCQMTINSGTFTFNLADQDGGAMTTYDSILEINDTEYSENKALHGGGAISDSRGILLNILNSRFIENIAKDGKGGAISVWSKFVNINTSEFISNKAYNWAGAVNLWQCDTVYIAWTQFISNEASHVGGAIYSGQFYANYMVLHITLTKFESNVAQMDGGAIKVRHDQTSIAIFEINSCIFSNNIAKGNGGAISMLSVVTISLISAIVNGGSFNNNTAVTGGAIYTQRITLLVNRSSFYENTGKTGFVYTTQSSVFFSGDISLYNNMGSVFLFNSNLTVMDGSKTKLCSNNIIIPSQNSSGLQQLGGAMTTFQSNIIIYGACILVDNSAKDGGAIHATESKISIYGEVHVINNTATDSGGGIHLYQSELKCSGNGILKILENNAKDKGGGIHAISSLIISELTDENGTLVVLNKNSATRGGGICMEVSAKIYILKLQHTDEKLEQWKYRRLIFNANSADYGAAVYVTDNTNFATCTSTSFRQYSTLTECFIQILALHNELRSTLMLDNVNFTDNYAQYSGSSLFGGLLDRCTVSPYAEVYSNYDPKQRSQQRPGIISGVTYVKTVSTIVMNGNLMSTITSYPVKICFCTDEGPNCNLKQKNISVKKAEIFAISLVAVDQVNHTVSAMIHSSLLSGRGGLDEDQSSQYINDSCSTIKFRVFSPHLYEILIIYPEGPCKDAELSQKQVSIQFEVCTCPIGFQENRNKKTQCMCECDVTLQRIITECYEQNKTVVREGTFWITYLNSTDNFSTNKYLIYPHCPLNYCHPSTFKVYVNLSEANGSDGQCNFNRTGILCGRCRTGFSLSIGTSHCIPCRRHWPSICALIVFASLLAGIMLVTVLLMLNITVATGTINGIIFYANVIHANTSTFLPFREPNFITVFVSWLNLEFGFNTCFFKGMDMYSKTLLQLAFPVYIIFLVIVVIIISEHSIKFGRLIGRKNPVATLATLVLFSYTRLIQAIITGLSFSILEYPDRPREVVWLPDGNIRYLSGRHIFLFLLSVGILLVGIAYTAILFSWQWLLFYSHKKIFKYLFLSNKLILFLEPYHAPYSIKHRYWTGLLLIVRAILYLASALNISRAPSVDLLVTGIVMIVVFTLKAHVGIHSCIYKKLPLDILETVCYMNILFFSVASLYVLDVKGDQEVLAYISGTITLVLLLAVLLYHTSYELCSVSKLLIKLKQRYNSHTTTTLSLLDSRAADELREELNPKVSWIDAPSQKEGSLSMHTSKIN